MSASMRYGATAAAVVVSGTLLLWPFLDSAGREGVLVAAGVALVVQVLSFSVLVRYRGRVSGFLAAWAGGMAIRAMAVVAVAFVAVRSGVEGAVPTLLSLAGFLFALLLLEPIYFRPEASETR